MVVMCVQILFIGFCKLTLKVIDSKSNYNTSKEISSNCVILPYFFTLLVEPTTFESNHLKYTSVFLKAISRPYESHV